MKHLVVLSFVLFSVPALFSPVKAQSSVDACEVELSEPFSTVKGKVVRSGNNLVFIDDDLGKSVSVDRSNIKGLSDAKDVRSIYLHRPVRYRERDRLHFEYRVVTPSANCEAIRQWLLGGGVKIAGNGGRQPTSSARKFKVILKKKLARDEMGTLSISDTTIEFESLSNSRNSRRWGLRDIRRIEQRTPYLLMIYPYSDNKLYTFEFPDMGLQHPEFKALQSRIIKAGGGK